MPAPSRPTVPFIIAADLRTGSTLLQSSLNEHPQIRCYGELFHPDDLPDNCPPATDRLMLSAGELIARAFDGDGVAAAGFRAMVFLPLSAQPQWAAAWEVLRDMNELRVIWLMRRDRLAQYASVRIAQQTRAWHPSPGDPVLAPENRPTLRIDPEELRRWNDERARLYALRRAQLHGKPWLGLDYEELAAEWNETLDRVQRFLDVEPRPLPAAKEKQERRPLREVVVNYDELVR